MDGPNLVSYHPQYFASISCFSRPQDNSFYLKRLGKEADQFQYLRVDIFCLCLVDILPPLLSLSITAVAKKVSV